MSKKGVSSIIGGLMFVIIAVGAFVTLALVQSQNQGYQSYKITAASILQNKAKENAFAYLVYLNKQPVIAVVNNSTVSAGIKYVFTLNGGNLLVYQRPVTLAPNANYLYTGVPNVGSPNVQAGLITVYGNVIWVNPNPPPGYPSPDFLLQCTNC